ncbi:MAG TPA: hypothetical protein PKE06_06400, partial [Flavilitoribacter sp.]|nr:hypothetical protein [Flavilitoribacter sp.]
MKISLFSSPPGQIRHVFSLTMLFSVFILLLPDARAMDNSPFGLHPDVPSEQPEEGTFTFQVYLKDSDMNLLSGGSLRFHDGSWHTVSETSTGTFEVNTNTASVTLEMTYNNGRQTVGGHASADDFTYQTTTTTLAIRDSDEALQSGGTGRYHQIGWVNWNSAANTDIELLPGQYTFEATINNGRQTKVLTVPAGPAYEAGFHTVTTTLAIRDSDGATLSGGTGRYHQITWADWNSEANTDIE